MATTKNLCAQIPIDLHERVSEERERLGQTTSEYIANLIQDYYNMIENQKGGIHMTEKGRTMAFQIPEFGFLALAMMLSNMVGGIDLSIIANANTVAIFTAYVLNGTWAFGTQGGARVALAVLVALCTSLVFGLLNGLIIAKTSAPSLVATLGTMTLIQGVGMDHRRYKRRRHRSAVFLLWKSNLFRASGDLLAVSDRSACTGTHFIPDGIWAEAVFIRR